MWEVLVVKFSTCCKLTKNKQCCVSKIRFPANLTGQAGCSSLIVSHQYLRAITSLANTRHKAYNCLRRRLKNKVWAFNSPCPFRTILEHPTTHLYTFKTCDYYGGYTSLVVIIIFYFFDGLHIIKQPKLKAFVFKTKKKCTTESKSIRWEQITSV